MKIKIGIPLSLNETGKRERQEDSIMPAPDTLNENDRCFVLCDGMGGHGHGDVAGRVVAESIYASLNQNGDPVYGDDMKTAVDNAYAALDRFGSQEEFRSMGTTMVCLGIMDYGYLTAHIGDSRIYHIRPDLYDEKNPEKCVIYQSWDHSLVNMLVKMGEITAEEAKTHPDRNVLVKAMQPNMGSNRSHPFIAVSNNIKTGDYFFLCSDGVNGYIDDKILIRILADKNIPDLLKIDEIDALCKKHSRDNYSCWLIPISDVIQD